MECRVLQTVSLKDIAGDPIDRHVVFGQVLGVHIDDRFIADGRLDTAAMRAIARCGYDEYAVVDAVFRMARPSVPEAAPSRRGSPSPRDDGRDGRDSERRRER